tara:strand:+ start:724 stop:1302 length:579 start_codon:yes stop_codon:yes gene_type:complete
MTEFPLSIETCMGGWFIDDKICDDIVKSYEDNKHNSIRGTIEKSEGSEIDLSMKDSYDLGIYPSIPIYPYSNYLNELDKCLELYLQKFTECNNSEPFTITEKFSIQKYNPGGGFKKWHFEETGISNRLLVFMTYLNDVPNGGTDFLYQNLSLPARKGLTVIWPAHWTHTHRGIVSETNTKYIATGWYNTLDK